MFIIETSRGALAGLPGAHWSGAKYSSTLTQARADLADTFADKRATEDRGDEFTDAWEALEARARGADVGDVLSFDEFAARIIEEAE